MTKQQEKYQMKRRRYGFGWTPVTWQAWLLFGLQIAIIITAATTLPLKPTQPTAPELTRFFIIFGCAIATLILFTAQTSPSPRWRWGKKPTDNPEEDI